MAVSGVDYVKAVLSAHMTEIENLFAPGYYITIVIRRPQDNEQSIMMSSEPDANYEAVITAIHHLKTRAK